MAVSIVVTKVVDKSEFAAAVERAAHVLAPVVVRIQYRFGEDWTGDKAIFFGVVMHDRAFRTTTKRLGEITRRVRDTVQNEIYIVELDEIGVQTDFTFRGESSQAKMKDRWP